MSAETEPRATGDLADVLRARMVDRIVAGHGLSEATERAFRAVPRHLFLPGVEMERVYTGAVISTRHNEKGQPISSSSEVGVMAPMVHALRLSPGHRVLEIGAGTGYNAAILAEVVGPTGEVTTVDIDDAIAAEARDRLARAGHPEVTVVTGDGWHGWIEGAPYDRIELTASTTDVSPQWVDQLVDGGILVAPIQFRPNAQAIVALRKDGRSLRSVAVIPGGFIPLRGAGAPADGTRTIGEWRVTASRPIDEERLAALLASEPALEIGASVPWSALALLAILEQDAVTIGRADRPSFAVGLLNPSASGLAAVEWIGGTLCGPRAMLVSFGSRDALARLRARLAELRGRWWSDLVVVATPTGMAAPEAAAVFERPNYTFGFALAVRAAATGS